MRIEQAVWGTFKFTTGFTLVSASEGLDSALRKKIRDAGQSWGEIMSSGFSSALYHVPVGLGEDESDGKIIHLVGRVVQQGTDGIGRTAWFQQILVIDHASYLASGADCFSFQAAGLFKDRWFESDRCTAFDLDAASIPVFAFSKNNRFDLALARKTARALIMGREAKFRAAISSAELSRLMRFVLNLLPLEFRSLISLTSFAFRPTGSYDLWCQYGTRESVPGLTEAPILQLDPSEPNSPIRQIGSLDTNAMLEAVEHSLERFRNHFSDEQTQ